MLCIAAEPSAQELPTGSLLLRKPAHVAQGSHAWLPLHLH